MIGDADAVQEVLKGVAIFDVAENGEELAVAIYGSDKCVCGSVTFTFPDRAQRRERLELIRSWAQSGTAITYIGNDGHVTLIDETDHRARQWLAGRID